MDGRHVQPTLLTGGTGTLGRAVVRQLADGNHDIRMQNAFGTITFDRFLAEDGA